MRKGIAVFFGVAIAGCGGSSSTGPMTTPLDVTTFVERYCALYAPCCTDVGVTQGGSCKTVIGNNARLVGRVGQDGETCLADLKATFDSYGFCNFQMIVPSCDRVLGQVGQVPSGNVQPGGECTSTSDCAPSARGDVQCNFADVTTQPLVLRCQEFITGAAGDGPCVLTEVPEGGGFLNGDFMASGFSCALAAGLYCDAATDTCKAVVQPGDACVPNEFTYTCASNFCNANNVCTAASPIGGGCMDAPCVDGAYCALTPSPICTAKVPFGAACTSSDQCVFGTCQNAVCTPPWKATALGYLCD